MIIYIVSCLSTSLERLRTLSWKLEYREKLNKIALQIIFVRQTTADFHNLISTKVSAFPYQKKKNPKWPSLSPSPSPSPRHPPVTPSLPLPRLLFPSSSPFTPPGHHSSPPLVDKFFNALSQTTTRPFSRLVNVTLRPRPTLLSTVPNTPVWVKKKNLRLSCLPTPRSGKSRITMPFSVWDT